MVAPYFADRPPRLGCRPAAGTSECLPPFIPGTNAIESVNARIRRAVKARGHFPTETAALKCVYLALMSLDPTGTGRQRWSNRWKEALNAFTIAFPGRIIPSTK
jgi:transposase-like protein